MPCLRSTAEMQVWWDEVLLVTAIAFAVRLPLERAVLFASSRRPHGEAALQYMYLWSTSGAWSELPNTSLPKKTSWTKHINACQ